MRLTPVKRLLTIDQKPQMRGLIVRSPWIDLILSGQKNWEIRGSNTKIRGQIALIRGGSGLIVGSCDLTNVIGPLTLSQIKRNQRKHRISFKFFRDGLLYERTFAWVLKNVKLLQDPIVYKHPAGAVIWVRLPERLLIS